MKTNNFLWSLCCFLLLTSQLAIGQNPDLVCQENQRTVSQMLQVPNLTAQEKETIYNLVKPCADSGNLDAICNLGILYKEGYGVTKNFDKSFELFKKSAERGHLKGIYALGYFYLKGLGSTPQDYAKATEYFENSNIPISKHWLEFCRYFGYGIEQNKALAVENLYNNISVNSATLVDQLDPEIAPITSIPTSQFNQAPESISRIIDYNKLSNLPSNRIVVPVPALGKYKGHIIEYDWSGTDVWRYIPVTLVIEADQSVTNSSTVAVSVMRTDGVDDEIIFHGIWKNGVLLFRAFQFELPRLYTDDPNNRELSYSLNDIVFRPTPSNGVNYITGVFRGGIKDFNEPMNPMVLVVEPEVLEPIDSNPEQSNIDIAIFPNPVEDLLTIDYELDEAAEVGISISNLNYSFYNILYTGSKESGTQNFKANVGWIPSGMYQIWFSINGKLEYRNIIKN